MLVCGLLANCKVSSFTLIATLSIALQACAAPTHVDGSSITRPVSGIYESLMLAVDSQGIVTGYFRQDQGEGVVKRCSFFLAGRASVGEFVVKSWQEQLLMGTLEIDQNSVRLTIERGRDHPGCGAVLLPAIATGLVLDKTTSTRWSALRRIIVPRAHLHSSPNLVSKQNAYVVENDVVGVLARNGDWLQVAYPSVKRTVSGWLPAVESAALTAP